LFVNLNKIRDWDALPGWIKTTTEHAAYNILRQLRRQVPVADSDGAEHGEWSTSASYCNDVDTRVLREEERTAVRQGLATLTQRDSTLLALLSADPPVSYATISTQLGIAVGSIGPTRARCLNKLAATRPVRALSEAAA